MRTAVTGLSFLLLIGCGGGGGPGPGPGGPGPGPGPTYGPIGHTLAYGAPEELQPGECVAVAGPFSIAADSDMSFTIDDYAGGEYDAMEAGVIRDADLQANYGECNFDYALVDDQFTGSFSDSVGAPGDTYDLIVGCANSYYDCIFTLTWAASY